MIPSTLQEMNGGKYHDFDPTFEIKLNNIKYKLIDWNEKHLSKLEAIVEETQDEIKSLQVIESNRGLMNEEELKMLSLTNKSKALAREINIKWHTLAKCNWIKLGKTNNKFYVLE